MLLKTPAFWYQSSDILPLWLRALLPLQAIYGWGVQIRHAVIKPYISKIPVICVGGIVAGGSGKTPSALALMKLIKEREIAKNPCFLTRGYGGKVKGPVLVDLKIHNFLDVGDEALLLTQEGPVIVSPDRAAGARLAESSGYDLIIMDDGFQNPGLFKTVSFIVVDGDSLCGNGRVIPFGPLREPLSRGLARAEGIIMVGPGMIQTDKPFIKAHIESSSNLTAGSDVIGFCGLGQPEKFRKTLSETGTNIVNFHEFPDHYAYTADDLERLSGEARKHKAQLVTTAKDSLRLPSDFIKSHAVSIVKIEVVFDDPAEITNILTSRLKNLS